MVMDDSQLQRENVFLPLPGFKLMSYKSSPNGFSIVLINRSLLINTILKAMFEVSQGDELIFFLFALILSTQSSWPLR